MNKVELALNLLGLEDDEAEALAKEYFGDSSSVKTHSRSCNFCQNFANYDAKTVLGPWADLCGHHFQILGTGLGLGVGQYLLTRHEMA